MDITEIIGGIVTFALGLYILKVITQAIEVPSGSLIIGLFIVFGIIWFIKEVIEG